MHTMRQSGDGRASRLRRMYSRCSEQEQEEPRGTAKARRVHPMRKTSKTRCSSLPEVFQSGEFFKQNISRREKDRSNATLWQRRKGSLLLGWVRSERSRHADIGSCCKRRGRTQKSVLKVRSGRWYGSLQYVRTAGLSSWLSNALLQSQFEKAFVGN